MKKTTPKKTETRAERLFRLAPNVKACLIEKKKQEQAEADRKSSLEDLWKEYQANLKKLKDCAPRINALCIDGLMGDLRTFLDENTYWSLYAESSYCDNGIGAAQATLSEVEELDEYGLGPLNLVREGLPIVQVDCDGGVGEITVGHTLVSTSEEYPVDFTYDLVKEKGLDTFFINDDYSKHTYRDIFIAIRELANGVGTFLDKFEGIVDQMLDHLEAEAK